MPFARRRQHLRQGPCAGALGQLRIHRLHARHDGGIVVVELDHQRALQGAAQCQRRAHIGLRGRHGVDTLHTGIERRIVTEATVDHPRVAHRHAATARGQFVQDQCVQADRTGQRIRRDLQLPGQHGGMAACGSAAASAEASPAAGRPSASGKK
ncbi:hypothetical protein G6F68_017981 [Rhizopus microsporus]|nr:hypothetical protein G6F68_017981 [Rhizopus microsporus]